ncbi:CD1375 family protein [Streptococcus parasuis]
MAKVYASLILKGLKTIDEVPEKIRAEVQAILDVDSNA